MNNSHNHTGLGSNHKQIGLRYQHVYVNMSVHSHDLLPQNTVGYCRCGEMIYQRNVAESELGKHIQHPKLIKAKNICDMC